MHAFYDMEETLQSSNLLTLQNFIISICKDKLWLEREVFFLFSFYDTMEDTLHSSNGRVS